MLDLPTAKIALVDEPQPFHDLDMADFPDPIFSASEARAAGKVLRGNILWTPETSDESAHIFRVAYDWRNSHSYPLRFVRYELTGRVRALKLEGLTAGRLKRMRSIRKKLSETTFNLDKIQDHGGCRAILRNVGQAKKLAEAYRNGCSTHEVTGNWNYIDQPKSSGYRSYHIVVSFRAQEHEGVYEGRKIEIQIRSQLQHAWATAQEAVGMIRGEDLKGGKGSPDWRRLFTLMSSEIAVAEGCVPVAGTESRRPRRQEIADLAEKLGALQVLYQLNGALDDTEALPGRLSRYFLLQFDARKKSVRVVGYQNNLTAFGPYAAGEAADSSLKDTVLVEIDKAENLRAAYPNYYLDVSAFTERLKVAVDKGRSLVAG